MAVFYDNNGVYFYDVMSTFETACNTLKRQGVDVTIIKSATFMCADLKYCGQLARIAISDNFDGSCGVDIRHYFKGEWIDLLPFDTWVQYSDAKESVQKHLNAIKGFLTI